MKRFDAHKCGSWSAVVRGAVMYGIEKRRLKNYVKAESSPSNFGVAVTKPFENGYNDEKDQILHPITGRVMAVQQLQWPLKRGDLVLPSQAESSDTIIFFEFNKRSDRVFSVPVYEYQDEDDWLPTRVKGAARGKPMHRSVLNGLPESILDLKKTMDVRIDLSQEDIAHFPKLKNNGKRYYQAAVKVKLTWKKTTLIVEVYCNNRVICTSTKKFGSSKAQSNFLDTASDSEAGFPRPIRPTRRKSAI
jgi:hypothetical protein